MPPTLLSTFGEIPDPRRGQGKLYPLAPILLFTVLAMLSGAVSYRQVHAFIKTHLDRLNAAFDLSLKRAPAYSSVRFILHGLDGAALESAFRRHAATLGTGGVDAGDAAKPICVAIDGKTLRGSFDAFNDRKAAHLMSAFAHDDQIILAHLAIDEKSNEIPAVQDMIATLGRDLGGLSGRLFTVDAMHAQKTFAAALATGNHLVAQLKKNQRTLFEAVSTVAAGNAPHDTASTRELARNRQEDRTVEVFTVGDALARTDWQPLIKTVVRT